MSERNTVARSLHDIGLAAWFGGSLMGAVGVNGAAAAVDDPKQRLRVATVGWAKWTPVNAVAIGVHLVGGLQLVRGNRARVESQQGVGANTVAKSALTGLALAATAYSGVLGAKLAQAGDVPVAGGTAPLPETSPEVASAQKQLKVLQWAIPALTGGILVSSALHGEQQRPSQLRKGLRNGSLTNALPAAGGTGVGETLKAAVTGSGH